jgi:hypothetical protein
MRRLVQALLALTLCFVVLTAFGAFYVIPALVAAGFALAAGTYILIAVGLGLVWPVLVFAFVLFKADELRRAAELATSAPRTARPGEPGGLGVEDPHDRERRDQR